MDEQYQAVEEENEPLSFVDSKKLYNNEMQILDEPPLLEAGSVYILMPKNVPITRTTRVQWLLDHLNTVITFANKSSLNPSCNELDIISIVPAEDSSHECSRFLVTSCTEVIFLAQSYRFIYCLDMSPSQSAVDIQQGEILFDEIINCFKITLQGLCQKFTIPGSSVTFQPCIYLTVIVNTPFFISPAQQVLVKGVQVSSHNMQEVINLVQKHFHILEGRIAHVSALAYDQMDVQILENEGMVGALFDLADNKCMANIPMVSPDANFVNMLRYSMLAISLLPENSLSHILVITDGVVAMPDSNVMESLLYQLHYDSISLSFLKVGSSFHPHSSAGYVSYTDLLHFLSHTTLGSYLEHFPIFTDETSSRMNMYHKLYLLWTFHSKSKYMSPISTINQQNWIMPNENSYTTRVPTLLSKRHTEENINASMLLLLTRRMREGYSITNIHYNNGLLELKLSLHWKTFIFIHYVITAQWPVIKNVTHIEVHISAPYDFLHDITCMMKKETKSSYRQAVFERFWIRLTQLASSDAVLAQQLCSFQSANNWYTLPESVRNGIPVFILTSNISSYDVTKLLLSPSDTSSPKFLALWQPICQIESNNWRKWFHTHKLTLVLKHDHPLPKHIHMANSSGRFQIIQCRQAATALYGLLSDWSSFILVDNHTYLKLLYREHDKPPVWFCIIRVTSKFPCATIVIGFLTGTPGFLRYRICSDLQMEIRSLAYLSTPLKSKENLCCSLLHKPLEKILIKYERMPTDFYTVVFPDGTQPPHSLQTLPVSPLAGTLFTTLSRYLFHQRWIWSASHNSNTQLGVTALSRILSTITRMRLKEGFHFAHSSSGIVTMVLELTMNPKSSCVVQYVLFPPHSSWWGERDTHSGSEEEVEPESELDYELQMVTEVWIEPQYGTVQTESSRLKYMDNRPYYEIAEAMRQVDLSCINSLLTLEHLSLMCQEKNKEPVVDCTQPASQRCRPRHNSNCRKISTPDYAPSNYDPKSQWSPCFVQRIQHIPFQFNPIQILPLCQQTELLFSMFIEGKDKTPFSHRDPEKTNRLLFENIHSHLQFLHDREIEVTNEESGKFTQQVMARHKNKSPHICPLVQPNSKDSCSSQWRCFVKGISVTHVILTFVPATLEDLKSLMNYDRDTPNINITPENVDRTFSQTSNYSEVPINNTTSLSLPMYVFDCPLALLVDSYINNSDESTSSCKDIYEDHRHKFGVIIEEDSINLKTGDGQDSSPEPKSDDSDVEHRGSVKHHCKALVLAHSKCFAMSLFSALHYGAFVHCSDVQSAMDQCEETVYEIDITDYIQTICAHLKHSQSEHIDLENLHQPTPCLQLKPLHRLIKEKFFEITNVAFNPIPTNKEFYYCRNLLYEKAELKHNDSDDEISNPPSELIEFKEISISAELPAGYMPTKGQSEDFSTNISPLFLHFICTIRYENNIANASVKVLPTCLGELIEFLETTPKCLQKSKLQLSLDILCLTLPMDVQNVITDYSNKGLRSTSFCSDGFQPSIGSSVSEASFNSDYKEPDPLMYIPELQRNAISTLCEEIKWLLKDEIATSLLDIEPVTATTLNFVMKHVSDSISRSSCLLDIIDLNFVYGSSQSYEKFVQEFSKITIPQYKLHKQDELYYLAKSHEPIVEEKKQTASFMSSSGFEKFGMDSVNSETTPTPIDQTIESIECTLETKAEKGVKVDEFLSQSDLSSINGSIVGTDGGYDEDVSECDEDYEWLIDLNNKRPNLPNFWLVMQIDQDAVTIYFHCRFLELATTHVGIYLGVQRAIRDAIRDMCKCVNQSLLLQSLHDTRTCDHLLEPDDNFNDWHTETNTPTITKNVSFSRLKSMDEISDESEPYPTALIEASLKFTAGFFSCPVVWETHFILHPRLKTGSVKSGIFALKSVLDKFSVSNRSNMFVYQDNDSNVFYLRLHESLQNSYSRGFRSSEFEQPVSRSPSIASLPLSQQKNNLTRSDHSISSSSSEIRPRVRSFGEKEIKDVPVEDTIVLRVHGITEAGQDVRCELVQVLQNRLDDAVLDFLSVMLARNSMCPLTPEDVHFLQKPFRPPEVIIQLSIQECALKLLNPFIHYLRQNLLQFLNIPKYTDSRSHFHFKDYTESEQSNKITEDNIFIYNQSQNPSSGNRGIACIALAIIDKTENYMDDLNINIENIFQSTTYDEIVHSQILSKNDELPDIYLEFRLWKQGRVNIDNLRKKLCGATSQATWDIIMEYFLLKAPLCEKINTPRPSPKFNKLTDEDVESAPNSYKEIHCTVLLDTSFEDNNGIFKDNFESQNKLKKNLQHQRSITFDEFKEKEKENRNTLDWKSSIKLDNFELGEEGVVTEVYSKVLRDWLEFGVEIKVPSIRKSNIALTNQHIINITIKELQNLIVQLTHDGVKFFASEVNQGDDEEMFVPYIYSHSSRKCLVISRHFEQWKGSSFFRGSLDFPDLLSPNNLKHVQKFVPVTINDKIFVPRQKILWGIIETDNIVLYTYNWSKDNVDNLMEYGKNVGLWLSVRASVLNSITMQKMGLFYNQAISRKSIFSSNNPYVSYVGDVESMMKFPKERSKRPSTNSPNTVPLTTLEAFKDTYGQTAQNYLDPVVAFTMEMYDIKKSDRKYREDLKKLHCMYQSRTNTSTYPQIQILLQNSRVIHYCHTPLLFLSRWRLQSAATRDHSIHSPRMNQKILNEADTWHSNLCLGFITEYKRYLQTLGFMSLQIESQHEKFGFDKNESPYNTVVFIQKTILGGILIFTIQLSEPFFITKLHAIECNRLQSTNSRTSINQFTQSFIDECDRIKILMHLHSFTYDFHLRCIYNYVSNNNGVKVCSGYHLTQFLDDFLKYYNKAPNYARNLVHADTITIRNLITEGKQLYNYLLSNVTEYNFTVFNMQQDAKPENSEYILVQVSNTPQVSYKDSQDRQHTDDFDVTLIVCNTCHLIEGSEYVIQLKYYLILTSRREIFPKSEVERKLGKFRTVSSTGKSRLNLRVSECETFKVEENKENSIEPLIVGSEHDDGISVSSESSKKVEIEKPIVAPHIEIKQESVNYLGYYSSHEQLMQQLILDCASSTQKKIGDMVTQGMVHCRTHLLWNKLLSHQESNQLTYPEFIELKSLAKMENLCDIHPNLGSLLNQPFTWYQGLAKLLLSKYNDQNRSYISPDGNIQHHVILHPRYVGAFMMLSMDLHTSRGDLYAVYRNSHKFEDSDICLTDRKTLLDGFINCVCFFLWSGMI